MPCNARQIPCGMLFDTTSGKGGRPFYFGRAKGGSNEPKQMRLAPQTVKENILAVSLYGAFVRYITHYVRVYI